MPISAAFTNMGFTPGRPHLLFLYDMLDQLLTQLLTTGKGCPFECITHALTLQLAL